MSRMQIVRRVWLLAAFALVSLTVGAAGEAAQSRPEQEFAQKASWKVPSPQSVRDLGIEWLAAREVDAPLRTQLETMWASSTADGADAPLLDVLCATFAAADPQAQKLVDVCSQPRRTIALPDATWLMDEKTPPLERHNLRLAYGRWLVQESLYDEAAVQLAELKQSDVVDPAALLFYQAVVHHRMLAREPGLAAISLLLENEATIPKRFVSLARLMQADLDALKDESLDHIARRMDDIRRRLDLGRAGPKVREVENGVIASLDKLIEQLEQQQQAAAAAAAAAAGRGSARPSNPLPDSMPIQQKGPGEVAKKPVGNESGWGNLPPKDRQEALQQIGKDFPAHYRDMIEQYFRKLANEGSEEKDK
jgi:hypothetical protein